MTTTVDQQAKALKAAFKSLTVNETQRAKWLTLLRSYKGIDPFGLNTPSAIEHLTQLRKEEYMFNQQSTPKKPHYTAKQVANFWRKNNIDPFNLVRLIETVVEKVVNKLNGTGSRTEKLDYEVLARQRAATHQVRHLTPPIDTSDKVLEICSKCADTKNASNFSPSGEMRKGHWFHRNANQWQPCGRCAGSGHLSEGNVERYGRYLTRVQRKKVMNITFNDFTQNPVH